MSSNNLFTLPAGPSELCFDKNEFMKTTFSVDDFLHEHRNAASLEVMRDDLGTYLKILRLAMIELINQDYGDFVNLSNKLVGLHEHINSIRKSLENLQININEIKIVLETVMNDINNCLDQKKSLIIHKKNIRSLVKVQNSITKLIDLLENHLNNNNSNSNQNKSSILERASLELMQSQFHAKFCNDYLNDEQKMKVNELNRKFLDKMRIYFLDILSSSNSNNSNDLEQCLRIYASLDKCDVAEKVFQEKVGEYMRTRITENFLQNSKDGLSEIYTEILNFISLYMKDILLLTYYTDKIKGFNFLINSYWKDIEHRLETNLSSIFAPGNPENFYVNFKCTQNFLKQFEKILGNENAVNDFRQNELTQTFRQRWNLAVYFQIRFQEIAGPLESMCCDAELLTETKIPALFNLTFNSILMCWSDGIYIEELFSKFLKLTIQIVSRVCKCIESYLQNIKKNLQTNTDKLEVIIKIYSEIHNLLHKIPNIMEMIFNKTPAEIHQHQQHVNVCFESVRKQLNALLLEIEIVFVKMITIECEKSIRQVGDIPRLYRKTNRDIPNKPSMYIQNISNAIDVFIKKFDVFLSADKIHKILLQIFTSTTEKYFNSIQEVLTSVQKTEESLKRLKSFRDKTTNARNSPERSTISDDDKIRLQLQLDVMHWYENVSKKGFSKMEIAKLAEMVSLIEDVTKIKINTS